MGVGDVIIDKMLFIKTLSPHCTPTCGVLFPSSYLPNSFLLLTTKIHSSSVPNFLEKQSSSVEHCIHLPTSHRSCLISSCPRFLYLFFSMYYFKCLEAYVMELLFSPSSVCRTYCGFDRVSGRDYCNHDNGSYRNHRDHFASHDHQNRYDCNDHHRNALDQHHNYHNYLVHSFED